MERIVNKALQTIAYFLIVLALFWIARRLGINTDSSIITLAIGSTIGWILFQAIAMIIRKYKLKQDA